jgi:hypothetical protein
MADLFHFSVHRLDMTYSSGTFSASLDRDFGGMALTRDVPAISTAVFGPTTSGNFNISTNIDNFTGMGTPLNPYRADGAGDFTLIDIDGDTITGDVAGTWIMYDVPIFAGNLSNVEWSQNDVGESDDLFDGDAGTEASMLFSAPQPWSGTLIELTASGAAWFEDGDWSGTVTGGSVDALVVSVPAAVLLSVLGLGVAGIKLRKYA